MSAAKELIAAFDAALERKESNKYGKEDIDKIYGEASKLFDGDRQLEPSELEQLAKKFSDLTSGAINKGAAMKKLQGTSRAESMRGVLMNNL